MKSVSFKEICRAAGICIFILLCLCNAACVNMFNSRPAGERETLVALDALKEVLARQAGCSSSFDARLSASIHSLLRSGTLSGYLQAGTPARFNFSGLGPFDQPLFLLSANGAAYQFIAVTEGKVYTGETAGVTFKKFCPPGVQPKDIFYWFVGGLEPGKLKVNDIGVAHEDRKFWYDINGLSVDVEHKVLIDSEIGRIVRHLLIDKKGNIKVDVGYEWNPTSSCCLPDTMTIDSPAHSISLKLSFSECRFPADMGNLNSLPPFPSFYVQVSLP